MGRVKAGERGRLSGLAKGDRIELLAMPEDPCPLPAGSLGTVEYVTEHDWGGDRCFEQVSVRWDSGSSLMLSVPPDRARVIGRP